MKRTLIAVMLTLTCIVTISGCNTKKAESVDLSGIHSTEANTEQAKETMAPTTTAAAVATEAPTTAAEAESKDTTAKINTYKSGKVSIEYPSVNKMSDPDIEAKVNTLLKENALSYIKANSIDENNDTLSIKCKVQSVDREKITVVYTGSCTAKGAAYPFDIFFTNSVDLKKAESIGLSTYADPYTMAGYVLSDDVVFYGVTSNVQNELLNYRSTLDINSLTEILKNADFPMTGDTFPEAFSYEKQGDIYFSIPVLHALGDYALIKFSPETK